VKNPKALDEFDFEAVRLMRPGDAGAGHHRRRRRQIHQAGRSIGNSGVEISTQYKIGSGIQDNPFLDTRMRALTAWVNSPEYVEALQKMAARNNKAGLVPPQFEAKFALIPHRESTG
jgi:hypothetical protein